MQQSNKQRDLQIWSGSIGFSIGFRAAWTSPAGHKQTPETGGALTGGETQREQLHA